MSAVLKIKNGAGEWVAINSIVGPKGDPLTFDDLTLEQKESLRGEPGPKGEPGATIDVQINGASLVSDGVAIIPLVGSTGGTGVVRCGRTANGLIGIGRNNGADVLLYPEASIDGLSQRKPQGSQYSGVVSSGNFDAAVKCAMADGVGANWSETEQVAARARIGAASNQDLADFKTEYAEGFDGGEL